MNILLVITQGTQVIATLLPALLGTAVKLKQILDSSGEFEAQIHTFQDGALQSAQETVDLIDQWRKDNGITN